MKINIPSDLVVFSDLDGTLLDHETYDFSPAGPILEQLAQASVPVVLASSKTAVEVGEWQSRLGLGKWPAIVENGAGIAGDHTPAVYEQLRTIIAAQKAPFVGFGDMSEDDVAFHTGLSVAEARLARRRQYSEPGMWHGTDKQLDAFLTHLAGCGVTARRGGRFLTLSFGGTKADRMGQVALALGAGVTVALGDAPNDAEMLCAADYGVVVRNDHGPALARLPCESNGRIYRTDATGPAGWAEGINIVLRNLAG